MDNYQSILKEYWGYDDFRGIQREIIESILAGNDTLGLMPTGGGKSITFQVPALAMEGVCIVITPLIALMKDQVQRLRKMGIQASAIYSGMSRQETIKILENAIFGGVKLLYVSPERISSDLFQAKLRRIPVSFIAVDEAHCISQWGYDFRPSYLEIARIRQLVNPSSSAQENQRPVPVLALTATATPRVMLDIQEKLRISEERTFHVYKMSFERKNLAYVVRHTDDKLSQLIHILQSVQGSAIVYVRSRKRTKDIADQLNDHAGRTIATYYHAGLDHSVRDDHQQRWQEDKVRVMVATNAFGMGIDKADVRLVIHVDCPSSVEAYFQEAGRAGRDGRQAYAVMLYGKGDRTRLLRRVNESFPEKEYILDVYENLAYYYQLAIGDGQGMTRPFDIDLFCRTYHFFPVMVDAALHILERAGWIQYDTEPDNTSRVLFLLNRDELYLLKNLTPREDAVITALLRNYSGLFTDYAYISLAVLANSSGMNQDEVYLQLKALNTRKIIHFIPQRSMPTITYVQRREPIEELTIPRSVYEERRELFAMRIESVWRYCESTDECRSSLLLGYFGEEQTRPCGHCDICLQKDTGTGPTIADAASEKAVAMRERVLQYLADGKIHFVNDLLSLGIPSWELHATLRLLIDEEIVWVCDGQIKAK